MVQNGVSTWIFLGLSGSFWFALTKISLPQAQMANLLLSCLGFIFHLACLSSWLDKARASLDREWGSRNWPEEQRSKEQRWPGESILFVFFFLLFFRFIMSLCLLLIFYLFSFDICFDAKAHLEGVVRAEVVSRGRNIVPVMVQLRQLVVRGRARVWLSPR